MNADDEQDAETICSTSTRKASNVTAQGLEAAAIRAKKIGRLQEFLESLSLEEKHAVLQELRQLDSTHKSPSQDCTGAPGAQKKESEIVIWSGPNPPASRSPPSGSLPSSGEKKSAVSSLTSACGLSSDALPENEASMDPLLDFLTTRSVWAAYEKGKKECMKPHEVIEKAFRKIFNSTSVYMTQLNCANTAWPDEHVDFLEASDNYSEDISVILQAEAHKAFATACRYETKEKIDSLAVRIFCNYKESS